MPKPDEVVAMAGKIKSPEKELRFTRSGQATVFWLVAAVLAATAITLLVTSIYRDINPRLPHPAWALLHIGSTSLIYSSMVGKCLNHAVIFTRWEI